MAKLKQRLQSSEGFTSYQAIVEWLDQECGLKLKSNTVNRFVREQLKAKLKVPRPESAKQRERAVAHYKKTSRSC